MNKRWWWAVALILPAFAAAFFVVRTVWLAYEHSLSDAELHQRVFEHSTAVSAALWFITLYIAIGLAWWLAGRLVARVGRRQ